MSRVTSYYIEDCGYDHEQSFPGAGVAHTEWTAYRVGFGDRYSDALDDALNELATDGWEADWDQIAEDAAPSSQDTSEYDEDDATHRYVIVYVK